MSEFRGSRRLMARFRDKNRVSSMMPASSTPDDALRSRLDKEAARGLAPAVPRLVKKAPKAQA